MVPKKGLKSDLCELSCELEFNYKLVAETIMAQDYNMKFIIYPYLY